MSNVETTSNDSGPRPRPAVDVSARRKANIRLAILLGIVAVLVYLGGFFFYLQ